MACLKAWLRSPKALSSWKACVRLTSNVTSGGSVTDVKSFDQVPGPSGKYLWPVIGPAFHFKPLGKLSPERLDQLFLRLHEQYGSIVRVKFGPWFLLLDNPADMETALRCEGKYPDHMQIDIMLYYYQKNKKVKPLSLSSGPDWLALRSKVQQLYTRPRAALYYLPSQNAVADDMVKHFMGDKLSPEEVKDVISRYVTEGICAIFFNKRLGFLAQGADYNIKQQRFIQETNNLFKIMSTLYVLNLHRLFPTKDYKTLETALNFLTEESRRYVTEANEEIARREKEGTLDPNDPNLLLALLASKKLTMDEIYNVMAENIYAGADATTRTLMLFLYNLARFPEKQQVLYEEIKSVVGTSDQLTEQHINDMPYLRACFKESMRIIFILPTGPSRILPEDSIIGGYRIPKGTNIALSCPRLLKDEKYFENPNSFLPERWLRGSSGKRERHIPSIALLPFSFGPRICLGRRFAEQAIYLAIVKLVSQFQLSVGPEDENIEVIFRIFATLNRPADITFTRRT
ncbi:probable cytochrome P450 12e1, mitochondrial [Haliotis rubra]|uniref:probable cytochrome P450 12e1, mitochondrial n=1 Tax=Haliotis rubra TaxID=36100 RepID=UPI001EE58B78|nr:probable cytochrome P450 12e1, mitochondrial [Haliotis rubra]